MPGHIDFASRKMVVGWALSEGDEGHASVEILVDGHPRLTVKADLYRADLAAAFGGRGDRAFHAFMELPRDDKPITITARIAGSREPLNGSPIVLPPISAVESVDNPDWYRRKTEEFLTWRFRDAAFINGIYNGHQPLYGYGKGPCEEGWLERYCITYAALGALSQLSFSSFLDVGGAEGYKGALVKALFQADVVSADLSQEACWRAEEIYGLSTQTVTMEALPFKDGSFDVVLCSEALEHVSQPDWALDELLRVARKAVVITVPHETPQQVAATLMRGDAHGHINFYDVSSFDHLRERGYRVSTSRILNTHPWFQEAGVLLEHGLPAKWRGKVPRFAVPGFDRFRLGNAGKRLMARLIAADQGLARDEGYRGVVAVIEKTPCRALTPRKAVTPYDILDFAVPPYTYAQYLRHAEHRAPKAAVGV